MGIIGVNKGKSPRTFSSTWAALRYWLLLLIFCSNSLGLSTQIFLVVMLFPHQSSVTRKYLQPVLPQPLTTTSRGWFFGASDEPPMTFCYLGTSCCHHVHVMSPLHGLDSMQLPFCQTETFVSVLLFFS